MRRLTGVVAVLILLLGAALANASIIATSPGDGMDIAAPIVLSDNLSVVCAPDSCLTISAPISERIAGESVTLTGDGELILSGENTYSGGTTVSGGTLDIASPSALPSSGLVTIHSGGRLVLGSGSGLGPLVQPEDPAPEPAALVVWSLLGLGWAGLSAARRRRRLLALAGVRGRRRWSPEARAAIHEIVQRRR